jgi:AraC-like DNA-binding protein
VDEKEKEQSQPTVSTNPTEPTPAADATAPPASQVTQPQKDGESWEGIVDRFTGKNKSAVVWASPYDMFANGVFNGLYQSTVDKIAKDIQGIIITTIFHAYLLIGYYLLAVYFDGDESKAFARNPYKETSINDLAKRDDIPFTRQKLTECIKAAAADMELRKHGHHYEHLHYEHLVQSARLKKQEQRLEMARVAQEQKLTSNELKKRIDAMLGKTISQDKQIAKTLTRQLREFVRLDSDEDVQGFLEDKDRSAVLDHTEIAQLLDYSKKFRETLTDHAEKFKQLEANLRENFVEKQQQIAQDSGKALPGASDGNH